MCEGKIDTNNERIHPWNELDSHAEQTRERWDQVEVTRSDAMDNSQLSIVSNIPSIDHVFLRLTQLQNSIHP